MKVIKEIIVEAIGLYIEGTKFYRDRKMSDRSMDKFAKLTKERNRLVQISNSYFFPTTILIPWSFILFFLIEYVTLDGVKFKQSRQTPFK